MATRDVPAERFAEQMTELMKASNKELERRLRQLVQAKHAVGIAYGLCGPSDEFELTPSKMTW